MRNVAERFSTARHRRHVNWAVPIVCVMLIAGCGSGARGSEATTKKLELGTPVNVGIPTNAFGPAIAGMTGNRVLVWGGRSTERGDRFNPGNQENLSTGRIVSLTSAKSVELPPAPFTTPVASTQAATVGDEVLVIGQSCPTWHDFEAGRTCEPGSLVGALYDGASDKWHPIDFQGGAAEAIHTYPTVEASDAGFALISSKEEPGALVAVDVASATARKLAKPPLSPPPDGATTASATACLSGSTVVLIERTAPGFGPGTTPARAHVSRVDSDAWRTIASPPGITDPVVTCADGGALVSNGVGISFGLVWLDLADESWRDVKPPSGDPRPYTVRTHRGSDVLLLDSAPDKPGRAFNSRQQSWEDVDPAPMAFDCDWGQCITVTESSIVGATRAIDDKTVQTTLFWMAS